MPSVATTTTGSVANSTATVIAIQDLLDIPLPLRDLADFRAWTRSDDFPSDGRIDFLGGRIEVDMSPDDAWFHSLPKSALTATLFTSLSQRRLGSVFSDRLRYAAPAAGLSCEPDLVLVLHQSLRTGKVRLIPKAKRRPHRYVELQGAADLIVEIISDSSVKKDRQRLPPAYFAAGVEEFWLVDVRPKKFFFRIHDRGETDWQPASLRADGAQHSKVLDCWYRLEQLQEPGGIWTYNLIETASNESPAGDASAGADGS